MPHSLEKGLLYQPKFFSPDGRSRSSLHGFLSERSKFSFEETAKQEEYQRYGRDFVDRTLDARPGINCNC